MTQKISPFLEAKYGWDFGESGWNGGMDENLLKFSFLFDRNIDSIVSTLPSATNGLAVFLSTDRRLYFAVGSTWYSCPTPKWAILTLRSTGEAYQFTGTSLQPVISTESLSQELQLLEVEVDSLGTAAYRDETYFASQASLDIVAAQASAYTDVQTAAVSSEVQALSDSLSPKLSIFPADYGILSLEEGATDPVAEAAKWETMRVAAEAAKASVVIPAGTYVLPQMVGLDADNTEWTFLPGAVLKLSDAPATDDFILFSSPVNQRVYGLKIDGNRANQVSATFGIDNCACLVVDADNCIFEDTEIVSSPAKGFAIVSSSGGTNRDVEVRGFKGKDCNNQCLHVDGNNMTGFFERIVIDGVRIGATSHAGVALNDGAHDIVLSNVIADVQNTTWDAVAVRDSWDIQMANVRGKRGRNGVQVQRLNGFTGRIQMDNVVGELNNQSGILFLGCENINAGTITGRNNAAAGINIAATGGGYRCKNVSISSPQGYDDRTTPAQQWGLLVQGVDVARLGKHLAYGNTTKNVSINRTLCTDVQSEVYRFVSAASGSIAALSQTTVTLTFSEPMDDNTYDVQAWTEAGTTARSIAIGHVATKTQNAITLLVHNLSSAGAQEGTVYAIVKRRP